jgi:hypothetical protein
LFAPTGKVCRTAQGSCDVAETCSGFDGECPRDGVQPKNVVCRNATSPCDRAEACDGSAPACPADAKLPENAPCSNGDKCTDGDKCAKDGTCKPGVFKCQCRSRADCIPREEVGPVEDPCQLYTCGIDNTCSITSVANCNPVPECPLGSPGCTCNLGSTCQTPFACNKTSNFCEGPSSPQCVFGQAGCACTDSTNCTLPQGRKREEARPLTSKLRCQDSICRIQRDPFVARVQPRGCQNGANGCECRAVDDASGRCDASLTCADDAFCTPNCDIGSLGCSCRVGVDAQCMTGVCDNGRCVQPQSVCDSNACAAAELGCCCGAAQTCTALAANKATSPLAPGAAFGALCLNERCVIVSVPPPTSTTSSGATAATPANSPTTLLLLDGRVSRFRTDSDANTLSSGLAIIVVAISTICSSL